MEWKAHPKKAEQGAGTARAEDDSWENETLRVKFKCEVCWAERKSRAAKANSTRTEVGLRSCGVSGHRQAEHTCAPCFPWDSDKRRSEGEALRRLQVFSWEREGFRDKHSYLHQ